MARFNGPSPAASAHAAMMRAAKRGGGCAIIPVLALVPVALVAVSSILA